MGKSFLEVMRVLMPNHMEQAAIQIGKDQQIFDLPIARLSELAEAQPRGGAGRGRRAQPSRRRGSWKRERATTRSGCWSRSEPTIGSPSPRAPFHS